MGELWRIWKPRLVFAACAWALAAFVLLMTSTVHPPFSHETAKMLYNAASHVFLLKWVYDFQNLASGVAALVGGLAVLQAARLQIQHQERSHNSREIRELVDKLFFIANTFQAAYHELNAQRKPEIQIELLLNFVKTNSIYDARLSHLLQYSIIAAKHQPHFPISSPKFLPGGGYDNYKSTVLLLYAASVIFLENAKFAKTLTAVDRFDSLEVCIAADRISRISDRLKIPWQYKSILKPFINA